ncbi:uncharacterized protein [Diadema setosum]|uniref:uncharacterized protein n=1 Tax=Diadema antillarum TaxID=105358 RepID=UPI003A84D955
MAEAKAKRGTSDAGEDASVAVEGGGEPPVKRGRGRPRKPKPPVDESEPKIKRPRGRPKGSLNKKKKPQPVQTGAKKPRGRPRKQAPVEEEEVEAGDDGDDDETS